MRTTRHAPVHDSDVHRGIRKVLMINYADSWIGGPFAKRSARIGKYLARFGWLPTIWTADEIEGLPPDTSACDEWGSKSATSPRNAGSGILAMRRSLRGFVNARAGEGLTAAASRFAKVMDWRLEAWQSATSPPDDCMAWALRSVGPLTRQIRTEGIDVIHSTSKPAINHWLALELHRRTNIPWVADFRDEWTDDGRSHDPSLLGRSERHQLEQEILNNADLVLAVSERQRRTFADRVPSQQGKFSTITSGFDPSDTAGVGEAGQLSGSQGREVHNPIEMTRRLALIFDQLADRTAESANESLAACQP